MPNFAGRPGWPYSAPLALTTSYPSHHRTGTDPKYGRGGLVMLAPPLHWLHSRSNDCTGDCHAQGMQYHVSTFTAATRALAQSCDTPYNHPLAALTIPRSNHSASRYQRPVTEQPNCLTVRIPDGWIGSWCLRCHQTTGKFGFFRAGMDLAHSLSTSAGESAI